MMGKFRVQYADYDKKLVLINLKNKEWHIRLSEEEYQRAKQFIIDSPEPKGSDEK